MTYSIEGLERGIVQAKKNIRIFKDAIKKEQETIAEYKIMIDTIKEKEKIDKVKNVEINARDSTQ